MKKFPLSPLPEIAGIYALLCAGDNRMYIGQTVNFRRRHQEWKHTLVNGFRSSNRFVSELMKESKEWEMALLREMPGATKVELDAAEAEYIDHMQAKYPERLLNSAIAQRINSGADIVVNYIDPVTSGSNVSIVDRNGRTISKSSAANILGCKKETLKKRLQVLHRKRGVVTVTLEELGKNGVKN